MGDKTKIEWADATWGPVTGCTRISPGCDHCYIDRSPPFRIEGRRFVKECVHCSGDGFEPMTGKWRESHACSVCGGDGEVPSGEVGATTGVRLHQERLGQPLRWRRPRKVFVCSLADLFHDEVPDDFITRVFAVMVSAPQHTFQVLTKRPARMRALLSCRQWPSDVAAGAESMNLDAQRVRAATWPLPNVWVGVTVENQEWAQRRIPILLETPAVVRFLSIEPMIDAVDLTPWLGGCTCRIHAVDHADTEPGCPEHDGIDWVICGGESGPGARPMDPAWATNLRDQCIEAGVPYLFKQWGEWAPAGMGVGQLSENRQYIGEPLFMPGSNLPFRQIVERVGKRAAGRELEGRTWDEYPEAAS